MMNYLDYHSQMCQRILQAIAFRRDVTANGYHWRSKIISGLNTCSLALSNF
ncbi:MAG: hypothetical protein ACYTXA_20900 [Nostoc sp.]